MLENSLIRGGLKRIVVFSFLQK